MPKYQLFHVAEPKKFKVLPMCYQVTPIQTSLQCGLQHMISRVGVIAAAISRLRSMFLEKPLAIEPNLVPRALALTWRRGAPKSGKRLWKRSLVPKAFSLA